MTLQHFNIEWASVRNTILCLYHNLRKRQQKEEKQHKVFLAHSTVYRKYRSTSSHHGTQSEKVYTATFTRISSRTV